MIKLIVLAVVLVVIAALFATQAPEIKRYMKIKNM